MYVTGYCTIMVHLSNKVYSITSINNNTKQKQGELYTNNSVACNDNVYPGLYVTVTVIKHIYTFVITLQ